MKYFDVIICGGGLAGLTLARQIKLTQPERSIAVLDKLNRPLPIATHKVGESTVEVGAHYLYHKLQLTKYFKKHHLPKLGLRYFFGNPQNDFHQRPELGLSQFPSTNSYQIDRGVFENDLRKIIKEMGICLLEGVNIKNIELGEQGAKHIVCFQEKGLTENIQVQSRWLVDAMGRRRYLQRKLKLTKNGQKRFSGVWFRIKGRFDLEQLVPVENKEWHLRVSRKNRFYSTNHLMGNGYWIWLIPLASNHTSVGIVTDESLHSFMNYHNYKKTTAWLNKHEPIFAKSILKYKPLDFKCMRDYNYSSKQVFSVNRWACVGESGLFADPFYSPGTDMIGFANTMVNAMIKKDFNENLSTDLVKHYNQFIIGLNDSLAHSIQFAYPFFGKTNVITAKILWDTTAAWSFNCPQMFNDYYLNPKQFLEIGKITAGFFPLKKRMLQFFADWSKYACHQLSYQFFDYLTLTFLARLRERNLQTDKSFQELIEDQKENMLIIEELAQVLFLLAIEDVMPERLEAFTKPIWLNAWRIDLDPEKWSNGLFQPTTTPRDLTKIYSEIRNKFHATKSLRTSNPL